MTQAVLSQLQLRADTSAAWAAANPTLKLAEVGFIITTSTTPVTITGMKVGNGITPWSTLPLFSTGTGGGGTGGGQITVDQLPPETIALLAQLSTSVDELNAIVTDLPSATAPAFEFTPRAPTPPAGDSSTLLATTEFVTDAILTGGNGAGVPVGTELFYPGTTPPTGWLVENGALLTRSTYPDLWSFAQASGMLVTDAAWSTGTENRSKFSSGDGSTTFRIPDLITGGLFVRAQDPTDATFGRRQEDEFKSHTHAQDSLTTLAQNGGTSSGSQNLSGALGGNTQSAGGAETRPKNAGRLPIIKAYGVLNASGIDIAALQARIEALPVKKSFTSADQVMSSGSLLTIPHGMSASPTMVQLHLKCITAQSGWSVGDVVLYGAGASAPTVWFDATNVYVRCPTGATLAGVNKTDGTAASLSYDSWRLVVRAWS